MIVSLIIVVSVALRNLVTLELAGRAELIARAAFARYPGSLFPPGALPPGILALEVVGPAGRVIQVSPLVGGALAWPALPVGSAPVRTRVGHHEVLGLGFRSGDLEARVLVAEAEEWWRTWLVVVQVGLIGLAILISSYFLALFLARTLLEPVKAFTEAMALVGRGELRPVLLGGAGSVLGQFEEAFNLMIEQIRRNQDMARALLARDKMATVGQLAAQVAHETRNPLAAISSLTQIMAEELREAPRLREYTQVILREVERIDSSVTQLLEYARPLPPCFSPTRISTLIRDVLVLFGFEARRRGVQLEALPPEGGEGGEPELLVDGNQVKQVLVNLVSNALSSTGVGGRVQIGCRYREGGGGTVWVEDDGPGVPVEIRDRIFQPFFSGRKGGTGLGLAISRRIAEHHCGTLELVSPASGKGARFVLELPHLDAPPEVPGLGPSGPSPWPRKVGADDPGPGREGET